MHRLHSNALDEPQPGDLVTPLEPSMYLFDGRIMWRGQVALVVAKIDPSSVTVVLLDGKVFSAVGYNVLEIVG